MLMIILNQLNNCKSLGVAKWEKWGKIDLPNTIYDRNIDAI